MTSWGVEKDKIVEIGWGESAKIGSLIISADKTIHYSGRTFGSRGRTLWVSYALIGEKSKVFIGGDSGYGAHFAEIGAKYGGFDLAFIEIDGWNPGWPKTHLFPDEVMQVYKDINASAFIPVHWGVFDLALRPWKESIEMIAELADKERATLLTPRMGERVVLGETNTSRWRGAIE